MKKNDFDLLNIIKSFRIYYFYNIIYNKIYNIFYKYILDFYRFEKSVY